MRVLIIANHDVVLFYFRRELMELLAKDNEVYFSVPDEDLVPELVSLGCKHLDTKIDRRGKNLFSDLFLVYQYLRMMISIKPNIILSYTIKPNVYGGLVSRLLKIPLIANVTGLGTSINNQGLLQKFTLYMYKIGLKKSFCVFFQNKQNLSLAIKEKIVQNNYKLIPGSGVNISWFSKQEYPSTQSLIRFLFIGRIMRDKGIDELLMAAQKVKEKHPHTHIDIIGNVVENYKDILLQAQSSGLVHWHGRQKDIRSFLKQCHCLVLPSYHEGMANVLLEAAASGRPVITTRIPGCQETFDEGISGLGCDARDAKSLADAMNRFIELSWEQKREMGLAGRAKMEREFDRNIVIRAYLEEINRVMIEKKGKETYGN